MPFYPPPPPTRERTRPEEKRRTEPVAHLCCEWQSSLQGAAGQTGQLPHSRRRGRTGTGPGPGGDSAHGSPGPTQASTQGGQDGRRKRRQATAGEAALSLQQEAFTEGPRGAGGGRARWEAGGRTPRRTSPGLGAPPLGSQPVCLVLRLRSSLRPGAAVLGGFWF